MRTPAGDVVRDDSGRLAGRGAYVCRTTDCLDRAIRKGALGRALKTSLPTDLRVALFGGLTDQDTIEGGTRGQE